MKFLLLVIVLTSYNVAISQEQIHFYKFPQKMGMQPGLKAVGNLIYFIAADSSLGQTNIVYKLFRTNGTLEGTFGIKDFKSSRLIDEFQSVGNKLFFYDKNLTGYVNELWVSEGEVSNTRQLSIPGFDDNSFIRVINFETFSATSKYIFFVGYIPNDNAYLYSVDEAETVRKLEKTGTPSNFTKQVINDELLIFCKTSGSTTNSFNYNLIKSGGLISNTHSLYTINEYPRNLIFNALDNVNNNYLIGLLSSYGGNSSATTKYLAKLEPPFFEIDSFYKLNTPGVEPLLDVSYVANRYATSTIASRYPENTVGNKYNFFGFSEAEGWEFWTTDGTKSGTFRISSLFPDAQASIMYGAGFLFSVNGQQLMTIPGSIIKTNMQRGSIDTVWSYPPPFTSFGVRISARKHFNGSVYFIKDDQSIWKTDGTKSGTAGIQYFDNGTSLWPNPKEAQTFELIGDTAYFNTGQFSGTPYFANYLSKQIISYYNWTGSISDEFNNPGNWLENKIPTDNDRIFIQSNIKANYPKVLSDLILRGIYLHNGSKITIANNVHLSIVK